MGAFSNKNAVLKIPTMKPQNLKVHCSILVLLCLLFPFAVPKNMAVAADRDKPALIGWGINGTDEKSLDVFMSKAADVGFDALITWSVDPVFLRKAVEAGAKYHIAIYSAIAPMSRMGALWKKRYPTREVPWQVMNEDEEAARRFIMSGNNQFLMPYQFGGEPVLTHEVLAERTLCFSDPDAKALFRPLIDDIVAVPGIAGLAFDGFGYENYHRCYCDRCEKLFQEYRLKHPEQTQSDAEKTFFRDMLVNYINDLADYARSKNPAIKTDIHVWPVFTPEPLYGNRLDLDYCGQTAAWYFFWPQDKIASYSHIIADDAKKYFPRPQGEGMIGYYDKPGKFPVKDTKRVEMELKTMLSNGCRRVQVCSSIDVINNKKIAAVFRKHFKSH